MLPTHKLFTVCGQATTSAATTWYAASADQGHPGAMNNLALLLEDGYGEGGEGAALEW